MKDRRSHRRYEPEEPLGARLSSSIPARICDISRNGVQLEVQKSLRPNLPCEFKIVHGDESMVVRGVVRRCRVWGFGVSDRGERVIIYRAGVEFDENPDILRRLGFPTSSSEHVPVVAEPEDAKDEAPRREVEAEERKRKRSGPVKIRFSAERLRDALARKSADNDSK